MNGSGSRNGETRIAVALCMAIATIAQGVPREFAADVTRPRTFQTECYRGETLEIAARLTDGGRPYAVPAGASAAMLVSTNGADWWEWPASVTTGGVVSATWEPRMDSGAAAHRIFLGVSEGGTNRNYGANMLLRMLGSPGEAPNALPLPARRIDFALVSVTNAPWTTPADIPDVAAMTASVARSATNYTDAAVASSTNGLLRSEVDPVWEREKGGYARTEGVDVTFRPMGDDGGWVKIGTLAGTPYVEIDGTRIYQWTIESGDAAVADAATNYADRASAGATNALDTAIRTRGYLTSHQDISGKADKTAVPGTVSNVVTKTYVESLGIEAGIDGAGVSNIVTKSYVEGLGVEAGVSGQAVTNIVDGKIAELDIDQESLARAVQVGEDLALIDADTNGWHIAVSTLVEADQTHIHGTLIVGDTIYGAPKNGGRIDLDGCDFFYNRQIPGDTTQTNGYGNIVTDPYLMWWARDFFASFAATNAAMWNAIATIHDLPATLGNDLQAYNSITASVQTATAQVTAMRNEVNATNAVIRQAIAQALSQASGGGGSAWTSSENSDGSITLSDHEICVCSYSGSSIGIAPPMWSGAPSHCMVFFTSAYDWQSSSPSIYIDSSASVYHDEYDSAGSYYSNGGLYLFDIWQLSEWHIFIRVCPVGYAYL